MVRILKLWIALLLGGPFSSAVSSGGSVANLEDVSLAALEARLTEIESELKQLARVSLRSGIGAIGYRSASYGEARSSEWVEVALDRAYPIDEIVLVPTLSRNSKEGFHSDGFPSAFRVVAGMGREDEGTVIATYDVSDQLLPRIAPVTIPIGGIVAEWVRVEATQLSSRAFKGRYIFQLSEMMVFSGVRNVALRQPVTASSVHRRDLVHAWDLSFLVDGYLPYIMQAAEGEPSVAYIGSVGLHPAFVIDLGEAHRLSEIHLHAVDQSDTVPQAYPGNLGIPKNLVVEGALREDFSDAVLLLEIVSKSFTDTAPLMMWPLPDNSCRYVRIRCPDEEIRFRFGFGEIELFADGRNLALNKLVFPRGGEEQVLGNLGRSPTALTDGRNLYGNILPIRSWMNQLARRHDLETERPKIIEELNRRYARQKTNLRRMSWLAVGLAAAVGFIILFDRMLRIRQVTQLREQFAADLHDELGANIHSIGLLGDLAREARSRDELLELLDCSREFTERSGLAIRHCINMLEAKDLCEDLGEDVKRCSASLLIDLEHDLSFEGREFSKHLKQRQRVGIFLFYKECLTNILRHSGATRVITYLKATPNELILLVTDNGQGMKGEMPPSLKRRARLLGAEVASERPNEGGTRIRLKFKTRRYRLF